MIGGRVLMQSQDSVYCIIAVITCGCGYLDWYFRKQSASNYVKYYNALYNIDLLKWHLDCKNYTSTDYNSIRVYSETKKKLQNGEEKKKRKRKLMKSYRPTSLLLFAFISP